MDGQPPCGGSKHFSGKTNDKHNGLGSNSVKCEGIRMANGWNLFVSIMIRFSKWAQGKSLQLDIQCYQIVGTYFPLNMKYIHEKRFPLSKKARTSFFLKKNLPLQYTYSVSWVSLSCTPTNHTRPKLWHV